MRPSILDRLLSSSGSSASARDRNDTRLLAESIRRDVENLLNTRSSHPDDWEKHHADAMKTVIGYGLPDRAINPSSKEEVNQFAEQVSRAVQRFEPRLKQVSVTSLDTPRSLTPEVALVIKATIQVRDHRERIIWNSFLRDGLIELKVSDD